MGVFNVLGPKFFQFDMAMVREFRIREGLNFQFRAEAFNVFNNVRFNANNTGSSPTNPSVTLTNPGTFGNITSAADPRILQLALKLTF